jgi:serine/threonine protein kinase
LRCQPDNCLIGRNRDLKICDFGQSVFTAGRAAYTRGHGTLTFMPPEAFGTGPYDYEPRRFDVYSVGYCLLFLATGQRRTDFPPFRGRSPAEVEQLLFSGAQPDLGSSSLAEDTRRLIESTLRDDPMARPSMRELLANLKGLLAGFDIDGRPSQRGQELVSTRSRLAHDSDGHCDVENPIRARATDMMEL